MRKKELAWLVFVTVGIGAGILLLASTVKWKREPIVCPSYETVRETKIMWFGKVPLTVAYLGERCIEGEGK